MRNVRVSELDRKPVEAQDVEIVERKGMGHPDSLCDGIAEAVSQALAQMYLDRVGKVLHYNTDETQLVAGEAAPAFGGGEVLQPIYVLIVGRATKEYDGERFPAEATALSAAREYLASVAPELDLASDVVIDVKLGEGSGDLQQVFGENGTVPSSNDTSFGVGHAPLTETEQIVRETERSLNEEYSIDNPEVGPDVKVMGKREDDHIDITVAVAIVDRHVSGMDDYEAAVAGVREHVQELASSFTDRTVSVAVNTADEPSEGSIYLTTTGLSAEQGDDGSVGRGNRANGLITPNRPMSMEASSGKNPVNHVGKLYNLLSTEIAHAIVDEVDGIRDLQVRVLSRIGSPIDQPHVADVQIVPAEGVALADVEPEIREIVDRELADVTGLTRRIIEGKISTF